MCNCLLRILIDAAIDLSTVCQLICFPRPLVHFRLRRKHFAGSSKTTRMLGTTTTCLPPVNQASNFTTDTPDTSVSIETLLPAGFSQTRSQQQHQADVSITASHWLCRAYWLLTNRVTISAFAGRDHLQNQLEPSSSS